jgi:flavin reductase (DIM6/NTAB) family NADH-FMN oxidoreductase RutF
MDMKSFDASENFVDNYKFLIGGILPRPIAVVGTRNDDGTNNIAPFSFFTGISAKPMIVAFCPLIRSSNGEKKDTVINIEREKEFTINMCTRSIAQKVNMTSSELPYGQDEFIFSGLTPIPGQKVSAPRLSESPVQYECILRDILNYGDDPGAGRIITGEVVKIHVAKEVLDNGRILTQAANPVGRGAGNDWFETSNPFELNRLMKSQIQK